MPFLTEFLYLYGRVTDLVLINILLALAAYVTFSCGQFSLAVPGFSLVGAYTSALLTIRLGWPFWLVLLAGMAVPMLIALLVGLPVLRLEGVYLALATLGLVQVLQILADNLEFTGGAMGIMRIPTKSSTGTLAVSVLVFIYVHWVVERSKLGAGFRAMRHDRQLARVLGIDLVRYNIVAFLLSAAMAGFAGGLSAHARNAVYPGEFGFNLVVMVLTFCIVGGLDRFGGCVLGAILLTLLPEVLRPLQEYRLIFNGLTLLAVSLLLKRGLLGLVDDAWALASGTAAR